jgi:propanediol dehydratase large subunit
MLRTSSANTDTLVRLIENELKDLKRGDAAKKVRAALSQVAKKAKVDSETEDNLISWLTETSPDVRQMIMVQTIEELLKDEAIRVDILKALSKISTEENVRMVMDWVKKGVLTLNQGVYVLLYPESSATLE